MIPENLAKNPFPFYMPKIVKNMPLSLSLSLYIYVTLLPFRGPFSSPSDVPLTLHPNPNHTFIIFLVLHGLPITRE